MRHPSHDEDEIDGAVAEDLVGDVHVAAARVLNGSGVSTIGRNRGRCDRAASLSRRGLGDVGDEAVAAPMRGLDEPRRMGVVAERSSDFADADLQRAVGDEHARPDGVEQLRFANQAARASGEVLQQRERFRRQRNRAGVSVELAAGRIDAKTIEGEHDVRRHSARGPQPRRSYSDLSPLRNVTPHRCFGLPRSTKAIGPRSDQPDEEQPDTSEHALRPRCATRDLCHSDLIRELTFGPADGRRV